MLPELSEFRNEEFLKLVVDRVIAKIFKMPVQYSNSKISANPLIASQLLQILIPNRFNRLLGQKGQFKPIYTSALS